MWRDWLVTVTQFVFREKQSSENSKKSQTTTHHHHMEEQQDSANKRVKTSADGPIDMLNPNINVESLKAQFQQGTPYPHVVIPNLCKPEYALAMHEEIKKLQGTLKETDLFKVYQTGDLANAEENDERLKHLLALQRELNTPKFREMIGEICGCPGEISDKIDLAANVYATGCHLLCHDDVIGSRIVSYIVYLGDPEDEPWTGEDGGRLQLYPSNKQTGLPEAEPTVQVPPTFNTMAMFKVEPGVSFHSVEEVYSQTKNRVSLQGWFHRKQELSMEEKAG